MEGSKSIPPLSSSTSSEENTEVNEANEANLQKSDNDISQVKEASHIQGLKKRGSSSQNSTGQAKSLLNRKVFSSEVLKLEKMGIPESYLDGCEKYAKYLSQSYPRDTHKVLTLGKQCCMVNAFLHRGSADSFDEYVIPRPCSGIKVMVESCIDESNGEVDYPKMYGIFDGLMPKKEELDGKTLIISRNLCLIESMALVKPYLETYFKENDIPYHFDFAISEVPSGYVDTDGCETTTQQYYEKMAVMENDPNTSVFKGPPEEINADARWFTAFMCMGADYYVPPSDGDIKYGLPEFEKNPDHQHLMDFLEKKGR